LTLDTASHARLINLILPTTIASVTLSLPHTCRADNGGVSSSIPSNPSAVDLRLEDFDLAVDIDKLSFDGGGSSVNIGRYGETGRRADFYTPSWTAHPLCGRKVMLEQAEMLLPITFVAGVTVID
jgi:hypothetical protein